MDKFIEFLHNYGIFFLCIFVILIYLTYASEILGGEEAKTVITNIAFALMNVFASIFIAYKISIWGWNSENAKNQKKLAKTAIRHIRGYLTLILKIQKNTSEKISDNRAKDNRDLQELNNHLDILFSGIQSSENDFKELVNEEFQEQNTLENSISEILGEKVKMLEELNTIKKDKNVDKEKISNLEKSLSNLSHKYIEAKNKLPFDIPALSGDSSTNLVKANVELSNAIKMAAWLGKNIEKGK